LKQTPLLLTVALFVLLAGGYYFYSNVLQKKQAHPWDLVPSETVLVYEKDVCKTCIEEMQKSPLWEIIKAASFYSEPADSLRSRLTSFVSNAAGLLVSAHTTKKDDFDFVYYVPNGTIRHTLSQISFPPGYRYSERELNDVKIHEVSVSKHTFSWVIIEDIWIGSFTPFLIEDVIRTYKGKPNFREANREIKILPRISGDAGNVYIDFTHFADWLSVFTPAYKRAYSFGKSSVLDIKSSESQLVLNGFSLDSSGYSGHLLSLFRNQSPVSFSLKNHVPNRAITFTSFGINNGLAFSSDLRQFVQQQDSHLRDSLDNISGALPFSWEQLFTGLSDEIGVCQVEGVESQRLSTVVMIETKDPDQWLKQLHALSEKLSADTVFYEKFSNYTIREIPMRRFPEKLLWPMVEGFDHTYYSSSGNIIFLGDNLEELKYFLEDIEHEDIWGKSVSKNQFLESTLLESNLSMFINTPKIWNMLIPKLHTRWRQFAEENEPLLQSLQMTAFQFSHLNNTYYTNISIHHSNERSAVAFASAARRHVVHFPEPIHKLHAVKSHVSRANEILIQDSLNDISLLSMEGKVLWKVPVGDHITSDVHQIDFYNNGKLQYIFTTRDAIHILDRLGNYIPSYPLVLKGKNIEHLSIVDYDRSKKYRFLMSEQDGKVYMYDKSGNNLEGWTPREVGAALLAPAAHHRIKGKDFILAIRKDGLVHLYNRRGEMVRNFPLDLEGTPRGDYFLETGSDLANTFFVVVTRDGNRIKFNPEGKIVNRETLLRASVPSQFSLVAEKANKSYFVVQHDARQLTISDPSGKKIMSSDYIASGNWSMKYHHFGGAKTFISLTDKTQKLSYVFDGAGNLITNPPFESTAIEVRMASSDQSYAFFIHDKILTIQPLNP
jgi:hypothetical protein